jgi:hypothetical protein
MENKPCCRNCKHFGVDGALMTCFYIKQDKQHVMANNWCNQWARLPIIEVA